MNDLHTASVCPDRDHPEYARAFAELERLAMRGQLTLAQLRREIRVLRERFTQRAAGGRVHAAPAMLKRTWRKRRQRAGCALR